MKVEAVVVEEVIVIVSVETENEAIEMIEESVVVKETANGIEETATKTVTTIDAAVIDGEPPDGAAEE